MRKMGITRLLFNENIKIPTERQWRTIRDSYDLTLSLATNGYLYISSSFVNYVQYDNGDKGAIYR